MIRTIGLGIMVGVFILAGMVWCRSSDAQTPAPELKTIQLTEQQITGVIDAGAACLDKVPYACAEYALYIRNLLRAAKPAEKKEP